MAGRQSRSLLAPVLVALLLGLLAAVWFAAPHYGLSSRRTTPEASSQQAAADEVQSVRVATWNLKQFGDRPDLDLGTIAKVITDAKFDIVAIEEVKKDGRAVDRLLTTLGSPWRSAGISPMTGNSERFAFLYRGDRVQEIGSATPIDADDAQVFDRLPFTARFKANRFDFQLIAVHLSYTDTGRRRLEMQRLAAYVQDIAARQNEKDIIVLGDFNEQHTRPNLSLMEDVGWHATITDPTNLGSKEVFDNILVEPRHTTEWQGSAVVKFDEIYFGNDDHAASAAVSDHRPAYANFKADGQDND